MELATPRTSVSSCSDIPATDRIALHPRPLSPKGRGEMAQREETAVFSNFFIDRPIFASVIAIFTVLAGAVFLGTLPIAQYPDITPPTVEVAAIYPGANAQV